MAGLQREDAPSSDMEYEDAMDFGPAASMVPDSCSPGDEAALLDQAAAAAAQPQPMAGPGGAAAGPRAQQAAAHAAAGATAHPGAAELAARGRAGGAAAVGGVGSARGALAEPPAAAAQEASELGAGGSAAAHGAGGRAAAGAAQEKLLGEPAGASREEPQPWAEEIGTEPELAGVDALGGELAGGGVPERASEAQSRGECVDEDAHGLTAEQRAYLDNVQLWDDDALIESALRAC